MTPLEGVFFRNIPHLCLLFIHPPAHGSEVSPAARNTLASARIPRASKLLICGLFQKGRVLAQDGVLGHSLKTTNCIESVNALIEERCAKVDHWKTSNQRQRWLATALTDIEPRLRKVMGYRHLPKLREALKRELKIETAKKNTSRKNVA